MTSKYVDITPLIISGGVVIMLVCALSGACVFSSKIRPKAIRRQASWVAAVLSATVALFATAFFAIPVLEDFEVPEARFRDAMLGTVIASAICLCVWVIAARCVVCALRDDSDDSDSAERRSD